MGTETIEEIVERETTEELAVCDFCGRDSEEVDEMHDLKVNPMPFRYGARTTGGFREKCVRGDGVKLNQLERNPESNNIYVKSDSEMHLCGDCFPAFGDAL